GNDTRVAALEIPLGELRITARAGAVTLSVDGDDPRLIFDGAEWTVAPCERAVRYLAVAGGIDVPVVMGSRATLMVAGIGGLQGRPLRAGDVLRIGEALGSRRGIAVRPAASDPPDPAPVLVTPGPHLRRFPPSSWDELLSTTWYVSPRSDRVGTRL